MWHESQARPDDSMDLSWFDKRLKVVSVSEALDGKIELKRCRRVRERMIGEAGLATMPELEFDADL